MTARAEVDGQKVEYDGAEWRPMWKTPWRASYSDSRWGWFKDTVWCLLIVNALSATAGGRRWLRNRVD